jgi:hypothetical protein
LADIFGVDPAVIFPLLDDSRLQTEVRSGETYYKCR